MAKVQTGLDRLLTETELQNKFKGKIGYLCHSASIDSNIQHGLVGMIKVFGDRLDRVFSPQHGFVSDVQDNMVESNHYVHPFFKKKIYSLYSETRIPTDEMLQGLDHIFVDLQDVGTRIYTYIYTMTLLMEACQRKGIEVIILDRPNPIGGEKLEGNVLDLKYASFVGRHPLPVRHALTMAEIALMAQGEWGINCNLTIIPMKGWERWMSFEQTGLPWVLPSPNLATIEAAYTFVGSVLYEGTNISEGRGTTRSLEIIGHPDIEPFTHHEKLNTLMKKCGLKGFVLRPLAFMPTFQKHMGKACGGYQVHVTNRAEFTPWAVFQMLMHYFYRELGDQFQWKVPPYEYEYEKMPIDLINGTDTIRLWIEKQGNFDDLMHIESQQLPKFTIMRSKYLKY